MELKGCGRDGEGFCSDFGFGGWEEVRRREEGEKDGEIRVRVWTRKKS